ncbi:MAG: DUF6029 family protein [Chitinophagales bacterium]
MFKKLILVGVIFLCNSNLFSQGYFSGDLELRNDYYVRDTTIGAANTPQYDSEKSSMDAWLSSNYRNEKWGLQVGLRMDFHVNSNLHAPGNSFTRVKLGNFFVKKDIGKLSITGGHFYDQFGSGIAFRAYEDRFLGIDNSIFGLHAKYDLTKNVTLKAFGGLRNNRLSEKVIPTSEAFVKGVNGEATFAIGDNVTLNPGVSVVNRTLSKETMTGLVNNINAYPNFDDRFKPVFNTYIFSAYNTLNFKKFSWYIEGAYKTKEAIKIAQGLPYQNKAGNIVYTSLTYSTKGFGITGQFKRTENFQFRDSPESNGSILNGALNFIPPTNKQNSVRLPARYAPASQEIGEVAISVDITKKISKKLAFHFTWSEIHDLDVSFKYWDKTKLFRELNADVDWKASKKVKGEAGFQFIQYNQDFYEGPAGLSTNVMAFTPFFELTYKFDRKKALRTEIQYQYVPADFGQWMFLLAEFSIAPSFTISISDQWNVVKGKNKSSKDNEHYYSIFTSYTHKTTRFFASYVRQVEGIVCTGGVCRLEPSFNGVKAGINTSF